VTGRPERIAERTLDSSMLLPSGRPEIFRYTKRFILDRYRTKSLRCRTCVQVDACSGLHVNYVRAHGYGAMRPLTSDAATVVRACE
jgi:hypothetical protein